MNEDVMTLKEAIEIYGDIKLYRDNDIKEEQIGIVKRNSEIAIYKYRFEPL